MEQVQQTDEYIDQFKLDVIYWIVVKLSNAYQRLATAIWIVKKK